MAESEQPFPRKLITVLLHWLEAMWLVCTLWLGVWVVLLHTYQWLGDAVWQRQEIVDYLLGKGMQVLPGINFLNLAEQRHLLDVRRLFAAVDKLFYGVLLVSLLLAVWRQYWLKGSVLRLAGYLGLVSILLLGLLMLLGWFVPLFILLHTLLFPAGTWVFPDDSILIQLFPLGYFFRFGLLYVGALALIFIGLIVFHKLNKEDVHAYRDSQGNQK